MKANSKEKSSPQNFRAGTSLAQYKSNHEVLRRKSKDFSPDELR